LNTCSNVSANSTRSAKFSNCPDLACRSFSSANVGNAPNLARKHSSAHPRSFTQSTNLGGGNGFQAEKASFKAKTVALGGTPRNAPACLFGAASCWQ